MSNKVDPEILKDLQVNFEYVNKLVSDLGYLTAARILGYNTDNYDNLRLAGRIALGELNKELGVSLSNFLERMAKHLEPRLVHFYKEHLGTLQELLESADEYVEHDWFSANSLIKNYLTKTNYDSETSIETPLQMYLRISVATYYTMDIPFESKLEYIRSNFLDLVQQKYIPA